MHSPHPGQLSSLSSISDRPSIPPVSTSISTSASSASSSFSTPIPARPNYLSIPPSHISTSSYLASTDLDSSPHDSRRTSVSDSFSSRLMAKNKESVQTRLNISEDEVVDIESCIDNPVLAPLGRHVNKRRSPKRSDKGHVDINVIHPTSSSTFIQEQERDTNAPVTSLILRRRRLDCAQLDEYLKNLQPTLDPYTMSTLQSPLLHLSELDLSRNRLSGLPENMTSLVPSLSYLNLSHNQFKEIPLELCRLTYLQVLIMSQNHIEGPVPPQLCSSLTQLKTLRLCANQITSLPHTLARLDKLESLSLGSVYGGNLLTTFPADCIQHMLGLRELDLSHNKLCFLPADIGHPHSHLRQLNASDNKLEAIPKSIGLCRELRNLNLGRNQLTSLPTEIADLKQLDTLDLSENLLCVIPGDVADFLTKTTLLLTGNPFTRGYCDANRNPVSEIGGLSIAQPSDEERYAAMLKSLSRRAILNSAVSSSSSSTPTAATIAGGRESPRPSASAESGYEMDQDERLDYHLYYTRHALSSRPPSRAGSVGGLSEAGGNISDYANNYGRSSNDLNGTGTGYSTPRFNVEAVLSDIDSFFDYIPSLSHNGARTTSTTAISSSTTTAEPSIFDGTVLSASSPSMTTSPTSLTPAAALQLDTSTPGQTPAQSNPIPDLSGSRGSSVTPPLPGRRPTVTSSNFFPTLKELAARAVLYCGEPLPLEYIPETVVEYLQPGARPCAFCRRPYVKEWISSVRVKSYLGHPAVARRVRFCSTTCWKIANEQLELEEPGKATIPSSTPVQGATTGYLSPTVITVNDSTTVTASSPEDELNMAVLDSALPPLSLSSSLSTPLTLLQQQQSQPRQPWSQGMRTCKGGQTYWPVVGRQRRGRMLSPSPSSSLSSLSSVHASMGSSDSITKANVCSGGCLGGGVCEW
ncbi:hypothetical protein BX616_001005 [Lobosporangium transversale]|nr:hypothetical protein BX616_001005 [Lobosporangium transversale]